MNRYRAFTPKTQDLKNRRHMPCRSRSRRKVDGTALPPCNAFLSVYVLGSVAVRRYDSRKTEDKPMAWTTPVLVEICIGLEINGYLPAEF
jgi:coenzyme PQQ precursor peptide PqqA